MSNKEIVIGVLSRLPEDTALEEIAREIALLAGIKIAREQARRRERASQRKTLARLSADGPLASNPHAAVT